jgi:hypothetical protein
VLVENKIIQTLLFSNKPSIKAAAVSTITKLSLQAKALKEDSIEVAQILNSIQDIVKFKMEIHNDNNKNKNDSINYNINNNNNIIINSNNSNNNNKNNNKNNNNQDEEKTITMTTIERSIESLAAIVGKTFIKEEIVHGSYRFYLYINLFIYLVYLFILFIYFIFFLYFLIFFFFKYFFFFFFFFSKKVNTIIKILKKYILYI